jgi:hypothetical protein
MRDSTPVAGENNAVLGNWAVVGHSDTASGLSSVIGGGESMSQRDWSCVRGGQGNTAGTAVMVFDSGRERATAQQGISHDRWWNIQQRYQARNSHCGRCVLLSGFESSIGGGLGNSTEGLCRRWALTSPQARIIYWWWQIRHCHWCGQLFRRRQQGGSLLAGAGNAPGPSSR